MQLKDLVYQLLASGIIIPPIIEFITHKAHGVLKVIIMAVVATGTTVALMYYNSVFIDVVWNDVPAVLGIASLFLLYLSQVWTALWKKSLNPFLDKTIGR